MSSYKDSERRRAYLREYTEKNREILKTKAHDYYMRNRERILAREKAQRATPEKAAKRKSKAAASRAKRLAYMRDWNAKNQEYLQEYRRQWRKRNRHKEQSYKKSRLLRDLSSQDILAGRSRPTVCDICGGNHPDKKHLGIVFDHCHQRGHFRGWLCDRCNRTLGAADDSVALLRKMIAYLERHKTNSSPQLTLAGI